jgi:hypothetical protein
MTEFIIFTILLVVASIYSVLPRHRQLRLRFAVPMCLKYGALVVGMAILGLYLIDLYIETASPTFSWLCGWICWPARFWTGATQVVLATGLAGYGLRLFIGREVSIHDDEELETLLRNLFTTQRFTTFSSLVEDNYEQLLSESDEGGNLRSSETAKELLTAEGLLENHHKLNPSLIKKIITDESTIIDREVFVRDYLKALHSDTTSLLYHEVEALEGRYGQRTIPSTSLLLNALFNDCSVAVDMRVWNPIREAVKSKLRSVSQHDDDPYTGRPEEFSLDGPGQPSYDPILVGIELFDVFASQALEQDIEHHIFLHYLAEIVEEICDNFSLAASAEPTDEFPNGYGYLLKHAFAVLKGLVELPTHQDPSGRMAIERVDTEIEPDIIKNAVWTLVRCTKAILRSDRIPGDFQHYIVDQLVRTYIALGQTSDRHGQAYFATLHNHILYGTGTHLRPTDNHIEFLQRLSQEIDRLDPADFALGNEREYRENLSAGIEETIREATSH